MGWILCGSATQPPSQLIHRPSARPQPHSIKLNLCFPQFPSTYRLKNVVKYRTRERLIVIGCVSSSKSNLSGGESSNEKSGGISSDAAAAKGPPFLTIVAGFVVLFCIIWVFGSIIMWLLGPIVKLASSK